MQGIETSTSREFLGSSIDADSSGAYMLCGLMTLGGNPCLNKIVDPRHLLRASSSGP